MIYFTNGPPPPYGGFRISGKNSAGLGFIDSFGVQPSKIFGVTIFRTRSTGGITVLARVCVILKNFDVCTDTMGVA